MFGVSSILAAFVWPTIFYGGAAAIGIPILIHFLARRRFKRIRWAAIEFLLQAQRQNKRRVQFEDLILMLMRCLAVLLLAMLVARPFFRPEGFASLLGGSERTERIFVIDDSFSMGYQAGDETVFDRAKRGVVRLIELLKHQSPQDTVTVLRTSAIDIPVATGAFLGAQETEELYARIDGLTPSASALQPRDVFQQVRTLLDEQPGSISVAVYMLSDFQRKDWVPVSAGESGDPSSASSIAPLADWGDQQQGLKLILVDIGEDDARNLAITALSAERERVVADVGEQVQAGVANYSDRTVEILNLEVAAGSAPQPTITIDQLQAGETVSVSADVAFPRPGWNWVEMTAPADALPADDHRTLVLPTVEAIRILIVNGEPSSDAYRDETALLATAIRPPGEVFSGNRVDEIDETEIEVTNLDDYDAVVLANVYRISEAAARELRNYVNDGGGLAVFLGDQVDADAYNDVLYAEGSGLMPVRLEQREAPVTATQLQAVDGLHPMVRVFAGADNPFTAQIHFDQFYSSTLDEDALNTPPESDSKGPQVGRPRVIARFSDTQRSPAIVERSYGDGRVVICTTSCDQEWNDWAKDPSYVVSMLELVHHLSRGAGATTDRVVGETIEFAINPEQFGVDVLVRTPGYPAEQEIPLTALAEEDRPGFWVRWSQTQTPGLYRFVLTRTTGEQEVRAVAVNLDPAESDLRPAVEADLVKALHEIEVDYVDGLSSLGEVNEDARREFWKTVLIAAFCVLMAEQVLGWWFGRRV